ncbi:hypothetical protein KJ657_04085 [Patescibacteria group bacterium]|nr:hypothetical protein [Patescibacteria group bacterium]MBU1016244.1 hypothetical protein [Patescibacteria group bacterium]MBU1685476.1 hypothetical protein [Patescibacteria group bacterium]MBU1939102.1 hypothetical protein [Patescibacteria group bacterium]
MAIIISCSGQSERKTMLLGGPGGSEGNVAHAAPAEGGSGGVLSPVMPDNPAHISFRFPWVPDVQVDYLALEAYPYEVAKEGDKTIVTVYPPQGVAMMITFSPLDENGKQVGEPITITVEPKAKLGTYNLDFGETSQAITFDDGVQKALQVGENLLDAPGNEQFIGGSTCQVRHSVYEAQFDQVCHVEWTGAVELRSFCDGPAKCHTKPFDVWLRTGQKVGLYPVMPGNQSGGEPVSVFLYPKKEE